MASVDGPLSIDESADRRRRHRRALVASLVSGAASGVVGVSTTFPLELIRVRLQTQTGRQEYKGFYDCLRKTVRGEGIRGLYKVRRELVAGGPLSC